MAKTVKKKAVAKRKKVDVQKEEIKVVEKKQEPAVEEPAVEASATEEPVVEEPVVEEPVVEEPVTEEAAAEKPATEKKIKKAVEENSEKRKVAKKKQVKKDDSTETVAKKKKSESEPAKEPEKTTVGDIIRVLIFCVALGVFAFSASGLAVLMWGYYSSQQEYKDIQGGVQIGEVDPTKPAQPETSLSDDGQIIQIEQKPETAPYIPISVNAEYYKTVNPDYAMYIYIPGTNINYPVVQSPDREYYLRYTFKKTENTAGAIAIDFRVNKETYLQEFNLIISGHNRQDGTMFSELTKYIDRSFRDSNPYVYIVMDDKEYVFEIFAASLLDPVSTIYNVYTPASAYISEIQRLSEYTTEEITENDKIITLYTCNEDSSKRYVVHALLKKIYDNN